VIVLYERLELEGVEVPAWSLIAAADAYLYLEQPESAIPIYLEVLRKDPSNPNVPLSLFYAYEDLNDHDAALATIDAYAASQPVWTTDANAGGIVPNGRKANADITAAMGRAYADRLADAQRELERMSSAAPANLGLHGSLGSVYLWRGWPERAKREFDQLIAAEPEGRIGRVGKASTMLTAREFPDAESEIDSLRADFPENKHVQRLQRRWEIINRREAYNETRVGFADGRDFDGSSVANDFYLFASPMAYNFRPYLHDHLATADVREGVAFDHRMGVGLEYAAPKVVARTEVFQGLADNDGTGWSGTARWFVDDHWQVSGNAAVNTMDVPLRGIRAGVDGEQVGGGVTYRWHESQEAGVAYNHFFFSDGNDRDAWNGYFARRLITGPYHKLTATLGAYTSSNSRNDVIYFSPERDYSTSLTVEHLWNAYRRYERKFNQRIAGTVGGYWQEGFDAGPLWSVLYEHQWALDDTLGFNYGYVHNRRVYDGVGEDEDALYGNVDWRF
jgi:biofilm PGA synthesis protein PgaA